MTQHAVSVDDFLMHADATEDPVELEEPQLLLHDENHFADDPYGEPTHEPSYVVAESLPTPVSLADDRLATYEPVSPLSDSVPEPAETSGTLPRQSPLNVLNIEEQLARIEERMSETTPPESVLTGGPKADVLSRAEYLREQAKLLQSKSDAYELERTKAVQEGRSLDAFAHKLDRDEAKELADEFNRKAARRYFAGECSSSWGKAPR